MSEAPPRWRPPPWCKPPASGRTPKLEVHDGETLVRTIPLNAPKLTLGRQADAVNLQVDDGSVSRTHCALLNSATGTFIMDLDSAQGTWVDDRMTAAPQLGERLKAHEPRELKEGQTLRVGKSTLVLKVVGVKAAEFEPWKIPAWCTLPTAQRVELVLDANSPLAVAAAGGPQPIIELATVKGLVLGRSERFCDVALPHESVSRQHCAILHDEDTTYVVDLGSAHGTYVDGVRLTADEHLPLRDGALLSLGSAPVGYRAIIRGTAADQAAKKQKK